MREVASSRPAALSFRPMADFQWWLLLVGLVAGGGLVAVMSMDGKRREVDLDALERTAEANWISERLANTAQWVDGSTVAAILRLHRDYLGMPAPDAYVEGDGYVEDDAYLDRDSDRDPDDVGDDRRSRADEDLARPGEQQAPPGEEADARADREEGAER